MQWNFWHPACIWHVGARQIFKQHLIALLLLVAVQSLVLLIGSHQLPADLSPAQKHCLSMVLLFFIPFTDRGSETLWRSEVPILRSTMRNMVYYRASQFAMCCEMFCQDWGEFYIAGAIAPFHYNCSTIDTNVHSLSFPLLYYARTIRWLKFYLQ